MRRTGILSLTIGVMLTVLATSFAWVQPAAATTTCVLDSAHFDFAMSQFPDPADWVMSTQGNVMPQPIVGLGLGIPDPDNVSSLFYVHHTSFLNGDSNDSNFDNTATFRTRSQIPYVQDGPSWVGDAIGWRMMIDDGSHRLELALSRSPTGSRQVRIQNSSIQPIPFPWDNNLANTYQINRLANGNFVITLINADPSVPHVVITVSAGQLPASLGTPMFVWGSARDGGGVTYWQEAHAEVHNTLENVDYTFVYPQSPDPAVWDTSSSGNVVQQPVEGLGWGMADPDNSSMFLYTHPTPFLSGDPNNPNFHNTATFRAKARVPYVNDGSMAWSSNAIGWRMILDDGLHRLEVLLSRSPTFNRQIRFNNTSIDPIYFPWDNGMANTYEIIRFPNGDFVLTLINADLSNPNPVVTVNIPANVLPGSHGTPMFAWGTGREGGGASYWQEAHAEVYGSLVDDHPPVVDSIVRADPDPSGADHVNFTVTFSEAVSVVDVGDFRLDLTDKLRGAAVTNVSGSGNLYTVTVATGRGNGTIRLDLVDNDSIADGANNPLGGLGAGNGDFTSGEFYTISRNKRKN